MTRKPKYAVIALNESCDIGSFFNLLMTNGYTNVTFLTNLAEHSEVKKLINGNIRKQTPTKEKPPAEQAVPLHKRQKSPEPFLTVSTATATATVNVTPSTSLLIHPILSFDGDTRATKNIADGSNYVHCKLCDNKIMCSRLSNLTNHVRRHSSVKQYSCVYCPYQHNEMSKVRTHMASQHGDTITSPNDNLTPELQKIWCAYMEKCFPGYLSDTAGKTGRNALEVFGGRTLARMECSVNNNLADDEVVPLFEKLHNCVECGDAIAVESGTEEFLPFTEHIREKHSEYCTPYKCGECSFLAAYEYMVRGHIATKHAIIAADVEVHLQQNCDDFTLFVGKFFPSLDDVVPDITEELKAFMDTAGRSDDSLSNSILADSVNAEQLLGTDSGNENTEPELTTSGIECKLCDKMFEMEVPKLLMAHSKEHYCIKQFECPICSFGANDYGCVFEHLSSVHGGEGFVIDQNGELMQQAWMQTMKICFPDLVERQIGEKNNMKRARLF